MDPSNEDKKSRRQPAPPTGLLAVACLLTASNLDLANSFAPSSSSLLGIRTSPITCTAPLSARNPNDNNNDSAGELPAWRENQLYWEKREAEGKLGKGSASDGSFGNGINIETVSKSNTSTNPSMQNSAQNKNSNRNNVGDSIGNTFAHIYQDRSTDEFKQPFDESDNYEAMGSSSKMGRVMGDMNSNQNTRSVSAAPPMGSISGGRDMSQLPPPSAQQQPQVPQRSQRRTTTTPKNLMNNAANMFRQPFQTSSTDDFKRPHGMPDNANNMMMQRPSAQESKEVYKAPFQTSSTDDFRRSSDVSSGVAAPQQPIYNQPPTKPQQSRSDSPAWRNQMGQDAYESTRAQTNITPYDDNGNSLLQNLASKSINIKSKTKRAVQSKGFWEVDDDSNNDDFVNNNDNKRPQLQRATPPMIVTSGSAAPTTPDQQYIPQQQQTTRQQLSNNSNNNNSNTLLHKIKWPLVRDPPGVASDYPLLFTRVLVTILSTLSTRYMHLYNGYSPILASSATTLLVSTCFDRRLGQAAFCGSFAGMSGGHLVPTLPLAVMLGALSSISYEVLIHVNNLCLGIGGRLGATAFLATSALAKYRGVASVGRKIRRGLWSSAGPSSIAVTMILFHMLGAVSTIYLRESSDDSAAADPVRASSVVGLLGSLFITDPTAALALYGGTFVGMSLPSRLMNGNAPNGGNNDRTSALALFTSFAGAGAIAGLIHAMTIHAGYWNGGWGGKAGLCAFAGCWICRGIGNTHRFVTKQRA